MRKRWVRWAVGLLLGLGGVVALWYGLSAWLGNAAYREGMQWSSRGQHHQAVTAFTRAHFWQPGNPWVLAGRGIANRHIKNYDLALSDFNAALRLHPAKDRRAATLYCGRADVNHRLGRYGAAIGDYARAVTLTPGDARACNNLAWLLATCRDAKHRRGVLAVKFAMAANKRTGWKDATYLDTLAAACATAGQPDAAARWERAAAARVKSPAAKAAMLRRADKLQAGKVFVETAM
jgi:tetratricopeptide (TPR) repeat protein